MLKALVACLALFPLAAACQGRSEGPDCKAAANNYGKLVMEQIDRDHPTATEAKAKALSLLPTLKDQMVQRCEEAKWDKVARRCIAEAKRQEDIRACNPEPEATPKAPAAGGGQ